MSQNQLPCNVLVSIIVPVYNAEKYLERCLDSIAEQSYTNIEVILINDGSADNSGEICERYVAKDSRFVLINQINQGVSAARNVGLEAMTGEWCTFVDSDDVIHRDYIKTLLQLVEKTGTRIGYCGFNAAQGDEMTVESVFADNSVETDYGTFLFPDVDFYGIEGRLECCGVWRVIFHKEIIKDIRFATDIYNGEDALFHVAALKVAREIAYTKRKLYGYAIYPESACHGAYNEKRLTEVTAWERIKELVSSEPENCILKKSVEARLLRVCLANYQEMRSFNYDDKSAQKRYLKIIRKGLGVFLKSDYAFSTKIYYLTVCVFPCLGGKIYEKIKGKK